MPHIDNLGRAAGGYRLKISYINDSGTHVDGTETIVVDLKSTQLRVEGRAGFGDGGVPVGPSQTTSGWTNTLPGRIVPWSKRIPYSGHRIRQSCCGHASAPHSGRYGVQ